MYCVTKNGAARCAGHDTAIRLELRFFSRRCWAQRRIPSLPPPRPGPTLFRGSGDAPKTTGAHRSASIRRISHDRSTVAGSAGRLPKGAYAWWHGDVAWCAT